MNKELQLISDDPWLKPYENEINSRYLTYVNKLDYIQSKYKNLKSYASWHKYLGFSISDNKDFLIFREWAPEATSIFLIGDFNNWNRRSHPLIYIDNGIWEIKISLVEFSFDTILNTKVKLQISGFNGVHDRIPAYIRRVEQDTTTFDFSGILTLDSSYDWKSTNFSFDKSQPLKIYECHVGMAQEKEGLGTYREFADIILPRAKALGYNSIQLMAIQEHPYYGSYGYHVSNFFAASSRFGTIEDLKYLIDTAHSLGLAVIMDLIHSHAVKNLAEGLSEFDGSKHCYFHEGPKGYHQLWDSLLFNYGKDEVQRFLLSNITYWLEEFKFDGFRFDGITSMLYTHHGHYMDFDNYDKYFSYGVDLEALLYLQLSTKLMHTINPNAISIAEDMSGMPGLCRSQTEGGIGFDYRLGMGIPDYWIKLLKEKSDESWNVYDMWHVLTNRRWKEKTIAYAESHDQALVGDKTLAFWLMDKEMYFHMSKIVNSDSLVIDRGIALHKLLRFFTITLGGEGYLTFFGNEFGHPEWIDFPREGNGWSYKYARRQWHLDYDKDLKYHYLSDFEHDMLAFITDSQLLQSAPAQQMNMDEQNQVIVFERNNYIFIFNFSPTNSIPDYRFRVTEPSKYQIVFNSDDLKYGGFGRIDSSLIYESFSNFGPEFISIYCINRACLVLKKV
ncbi:MAG: alpha-amylase family glycosyl hydrolase [Cytophagales bacterium]